MGEVNQAPWILDRSLALNTNILDTSTALLGDARIRLIIMSITKTTTPISKYLTGTEWSVSSSSKSQPDFWNFPQNSYFRRGNQAVGVEYVNDLVGRSGGVTEPIVAKASRLVVVSAGAFGSPAILERSGIGAKAVLEKNGVKQTVDLPGVGENYMGKMICKLELYVDQVY